MAKKKDTTIEWMDTINKMGERQREIDNKLSPNKLEIRYIVDYARAIAEKATRIEMASGLAHEKVLTFEMAQQIIDVQNEQLLKNIKHLKGLLEDD